MTDHGVPDGEMVNFPWSTRSALDGLLSGDPCGHGDLRPVAEVLAALQAPPTPAEQAAWPQALALFRAASAPPQPARATPAAPEAAPATLALPQPDRAPPRPGHARRRMLPRLAAAAAVAAVTVLGGGLAAAYTGSLPAALQRFAHAAISAPAPEASPGRPAAPGASRPAGSQATGHAAPGLCTAYTRARPSQRSEAFRRLIAAAGGQASVAAYCGWRTAPTAIPSRGPGATATPGHSPGHSSGSGSGQPTTHPSPHGKPTVTPSHRPTATPSHRKK